MTRTKIFPIAATTIVFSGIPSLLAGVELGITMEYYGMCAKKPDKS
jgi:hypothetical protein